MTPQAKARQYIAARTVTDVHGCWIWQKGLDEDGYGRAKLFSRGWRAHRLAWETYRGPFPEGLVTDHLCRVRSCVNPAHLEPVTVQINNDRGELALYSGIRERTKTHCRQGHPYVSENMYVYRRKNGRRNRVCKACHVTAQREHNRRRRAAA
jgi:hypothetical protein